MGWAGAAYQYGTAGDALVSGSARFPAMLFLGIVMMPFYYISKTHSVPGYLHLRFGEGARAAQRGERLALMTILMSGVNMYAMARRDADGRVGLEHQRSPSGWGRGR